MGLSTHVLDTMHGTPAAGMVVALFATDTAEPRCLKQFVLNQDGRNPDGLLLDHATLKQRHAFAVNVTNLECHDFAHPQSRAVRQ